MLPARSIFSPCLSPKLTVLSKRREHQIRSSWGAFGTVSPSLERQMILGQKTKSFLTAQIARQVVVVISNTRFKWSDFFLSPSTGTREEMEGTIPSRQIPAGPLEFTFCFQKNHPIVWAQTRHDPFFWTDFPFRTFTTAPSLKNTGIYFLCLFFLHRSQDSSWYLPTSVKISILKERDSVGAIYYDYTFSSWLHPSVSCYFPSTQQSPMRQWAFRAESWILSKMGSGEKFILNRCGSDF